jgi:hypothetical protein
MGKRFKLRENKAIYVNPIKYEGQDLVSIRQQYTTQKEPDEWKQGFQGISLPASPKVLNRIADYLKAVADKLEAGEVEFEVVEKKVKETTEPKTRRKK